MITALILAGYMTLDQPTPPRDFPHLGRHVIIETDRGHDGYRPISGTNFGDHWGNQYGTGSHDMFGNPTRDPFPTYRGR